MLTHKNTNIKILNTTVMVVLRRQKLKHPTPERSATERGIEGSEGCSGAREKRNRRAEKESSGRTEREIRRDRRRDTRKGDETERGRDEIGREREGEKVKLWVWVRERRGR